MFTLGYYPSKFLAEVFLNHFQNVVSNTGISLRFLQNYPETLEKKAIPPFILVSLLQKITRLLC